MLKDGQSSPLRSGAVEDENGEEGPRQFGMGRGVGVLSSDDLTAATRGSLRM